MDKYFFTLLIYLDIINYVCAEEGLLLSER